MQLTRNVAITALCAATFALVGCPHDTPTQSTPPSTGGTGGSIATSPFDDMAAGAATLQQAAGMTAGARSPGLTTVAPLQQAAAYRVGALSPITPPAAKWETEGLFSTYFQYTAAEQGIEDVSGARAYVTHANYTTYDRDDQNVESGTNSRILAYKQTQDDSGNPIIAVAVSEARQATTSKRRKPGTYGLLGVVAMHEQADYLQVAASFSPLGGGASSSVQVTYMKLYEPSSLTSGTLAQKIAARGAMISEEMGLKGAFATGESLDVSAKRAGTATAPTRSATASIDLRGNMGKIAFTSDLKLDMTSSFPSTITGAVSIARKDKNNISAGQIFVDTFTCQASTSTVVTSGELRNPQGAKIGTFTGTIDLGANQWLGVYQQDGQATKSINLSGLMSQLW